MEEMSLETTKMIWKVMTKLDQGKLTLTKWTANRRELLKNVDKSRQVDGDVDLHKAENDLKILRSRFNLPEDCLQFNIKTGISHTVHTVGDIPLKFIAYTNSELALAWCLHEFPIKFFPAHCATDQLLGDPGKNMF